MDREPASAPRPCCELAADDVQVWRVRLEGSAAQAGGYWPALSPDEQRRAERFHFASDRWRFVVARGVLREIISRYLDIPAGSVAFDYSAQGKPKLRAHYRLRFNVTHSHGVGLLAFAWERELGVDVERIRAEAPTQALAANFFAPGEAQTLAALPVEQQLPAFFRCWTRKEAYLKAIGSGLLTPLDQFEVSLAPERPAVLLKVAWDQAETRRWSLQDLDLEHSYAAALAVEGQAVRLHCRQWEGRDSPDHERKETHA
jgi:4'-phosphopantetheinyl transferase